MTAPTTVAEVLDAAADLIDAKGWEPVTPEQPTGAYSLVMAMQCAITGGTRGFDGGGATGEFTLFDRARRAFRMHVGARGFGGLVEWSTEPGRSQAEVVTALREAAAAAARAER